MIYEEAIVEGVLCWRDCKGHGDWVPKTSQELTAMLMEARRASAVIPPMRLPFYDPGPVVSPPQPLAIPGYPNPPWTVTC